MVLNLALRMKQFMKFRDLEMYGLIIKVECDNDLPLLPRIGLILSMPAGFEQFTWFGRGPEESYMIVKQVWL